MLRKWRDNACCSDGSGDETTGHFLIPEPNTSYDLAFRPMPRPIANDRDFTVSTDRKCVYNHEVKNIDGEFYMSQRYSQFSYVTYEKLTKLEGEMKNDFAPSSFKGQNGLLALTLKSDSDAKKNLPAGQTGCKFSVDKGENKEREGIVGDKSGCVVRDENYKDKRKNENLKELLASDSYDKDRRKDCMKRKPAVDQDSCKRLLPYGRISSLWIVKTIAFFVRLLLSFSAFLIRKVHHLKKITLRLKEGVILLGGATMILLVSVFMHRAKLFNRTNVGYLNVVEIIKSSLEEKLFGQHLVINRLPKDLGTFLVEPALRVAVFLLIGSSGSGKTLTSSIIQGHLRLSGFSVLEWHSYGQSLPNITKACSDLLSHNSKKLFIVLEDVDRFVLDETYHQKIVLQLQECKGMEKTLIMMTSTMLDLEIRNTVSKQMEVLRKRVNIKQEDINLALTDQFANFEKFIKKMQNQYGLTYSIFTFLPLEPEHVKNCFKTELMRRKVPKEKWNSLTIQALQFMNFLHKNGTYFSETGCKLVKSRLDYVISQ